MTTNVKSVSKNKALRKTISSFSYKRTKEQHCTLTREMEKETLQGANLARQNPRGWK